MVVCLLASEKCIFSIFIDVIAACYFVVEVLINTCTPLISMPTAGGDPE
jgi:hypothetical protein